MTPEILFSLLWLPVLAGVLCLAVPNVISKWLALGFCVIQVGLGCLLFFAFDAEKAHQLQFEFLIPWHNLLGVKLGFAVDGLSMPLVVLTKIIMPFAILASFHEQRRTKAFMACLLFLDFAMTGTFLTTDTFVFYVFWELMLIPMILIIGVWGSQDRIYAALKFFIYTFAGSMMMLAAILWLFQQHQLQFGFSSTEIRSWYELLISQEPVFYGLSRQDLVFWAFTIAFLIKVPLFPLHTWLPDAHVQAPTGGSIILAAILLKMGTYGLLRFSIPLASDAFFRFIPLLSWLSIAGIIYGAWVAFQQSDIKKLVAYSSVSHLGFVVLGICTLSPEGLTGSFLQMINHGFSTGALFFLVGILYERRHSRKFSDYGGIAEVVPWFSIFLVLVACSSMAVPGLNGFVGEFLILFATFKFQKILGVLAVSGVVFGALYMLWLLRNILFGENKNPENKMLKDIDGREAIALAGFAFFILTLGVAPQVVTKKMDGFTSQYWKTRGKLNSMEYKTSLNKLVKTSQVAR